MAAGCGVDELRTRFSFFLFLSASALNVRFWRVRVRVYGYLGCRNALLGTSLRRRPAKPVYRAFGGDTKGAYLRVGNLVAKNTRQEQQKVGYITSWTLWHLIRVMLSRDMSLEVLKPTI